MVSQDLTLGSASPRRAMLLRRLGLTFETVSIDIDEQQFAVPGDPAASVQSIAAAKFASLQSQVHTGKLITADTMVALGGKVMGKPASVTELRQTLADMSGQTISIVTGLCIGVPAMNPHAESVETLVTLQQLSTQQIDDYVATGVGMDKAGGLALQAEAGSFIESVRGCWSNVVGLPLCAVALALGIGSIGVERSKQCSIERCGTHVHAWPHPKST